MIYGVDVSSFQGAYPWNSGESFGIAKATEGTFYRDAQFQHNWNTMWSKKILRGAYHFGHPGTDPVAQATYFVNFVKQYGLETNDVLMLDYEVDDGLPAAQCAAWAATFIKTVEHLTGKNVWLYVDDNFIVNGYCAGLTSQPLVIANPNNTAGTVSVPIKPFPVWTVHQYKFGVSALSQPDYDVLNGDALVWEQLANLVPPVTYKTVTASWTTEGADSLTGLVANGFNGTAAPGVMVSTVLRLTLDNSHDQLFVTNLATYINGGDLAHTPVPKGVVLFYPKRVKVA